jgi:hypothetical protein
MQYLYQPAVLVQPVIDPYRRMKKIADAGSAVDWHPNPGQRLEQVDMVKKGRTELLGGAWIVRADIVRMTSRSISASSVKKIL